MGWSEEVHANRRALQQRGTKPQTPAMRSVTANAPNAGSLAPIGAALGAACALVWWRREGRKLHGRQFNIPFLDGLQKLFAGGTKRKAGGSKQVTQQWKNQRPQTMAAAAASTRAQGGEPVKPAQQNTNKPAGSGGGKKKKGKNKKKR